VAKVATKSRTGRAGGGSLPGERRGGRQPGTPNKVTTAFRETVQKLLDKNEHNVAKWIAQVAEGVPAEYDDKGNMVRPGRPADPGAAARLLTQFAEYAAPKLNRSEIAGDGGGPLTVIIREEQ
jgi:hypothetical protein